MYVHLCMYLTHLMNEQICVSLIKCVSRTTVLYLPNHSSITTSLTHYGSYRTVVPFYPPTQNTINNFICTIAHM